MPSSAPLRTACLVLVLACLVPPAASATSCPHGLHESPAGAATATAPVPAGGELGQSAFAAISEIVAELEADPATDWSRVRIAALRRHLVDMDLVMTRAEVAEEAIDGGFAADVTGDARTAEAIRAMLPAHAAMTAGHRGWRTTVREVPGGVRVEVTAADAAEAERLRGLGAFGWLVAGDHHAVHHRMMARGAGHGTHGTVHGAEHGDHGDH